MPAPSGPGIGFDVVELDILRGVGRNVAGGGCSRDFGDAWILGDSSLGVLEDFTGNKEMLGYATGLVTYKGVMDDAYGEFGVAGTGSFGADTGGAVVFGCGRMAGGVKGPGMGY